MLNLRSDVAVMLSSEDVQVKMRERMSVAMGVFESPKRDVVEFIHDAKKARVILAGVGCHRDRADVL